MSKTTKTRETILQYIPYYFTAKLGDILEATQLPYGTVRGNLRDMRKAGLIDNKPGQGWTRV